MNDIRPQDLPELRVALLAYQGRTEEAIRRQFGGRQKPDVPPERAGKLADTMWRKLQGAAREAELFWVASKMADLIRTASALLPTFVVEPEDLPAPAGLFVFEDTLAMVGGPEGGEIPVRGVLWSSFSGGLIVWPYWDRDHLLEGSRGNSEPPLICGAAGFFTVRWADASWRELPMDRGAQILLPFLLSTWLLMQQPLTQAVEIEPDRSARKRLRRAGHEPKSVRVIELRRPKNVGGRGESEREYHHQWIVRGHWRNHWHPRREVHRPVWIAPHIKGPEGAPLIGGEKVYALKR